MSATATATTTVPSLPLSPLFARLLADDYALQAASAKLQALRTEDEGDEQQDSKQQLQLLRTATETVGMYQSRKGQWELYIAKAIGGDASAKSWLQRFGVATVAESLRLLELELWCQQYDATTGEPVHPLRTRQPSSPPVVSVASSLIESALLPRLIQPSLATLFDYRRVLSSVFAEELGAAASDSSTIRSYILLLLSLLAVNSTGNLVAPFTAITALLSALCSATIVQACKRLTGADLVDGLQSVNDALATTVNLLDTAQDASAVSGYMEKLKQTLGLLRTGPAGGKTSPVRSAEGVRTNDLVQQHLLQDSNFKVLCRKLDISVELLNETFVSTMNASATCSGVLRAILPTQFAADGRTSASVILPPLPPLLHIAHYIRHNYAVTCADVVPRSCLQQGTPTPDVLTISAPGGVLLTQLQMLLAEDCNLRVFQRQRQPHEMALLSGFLYRTDRNFTLRPAELQCMHWFLVHPYASVDSLLVADGLLGPPLEPPPAGEYLPPSYSTVASPPQRSERDDAALEAELEQLVVASDDKDKSFSSTRS
ncbi:hypothetical protein RI367_008426 [Sorochytrium milnesiophthora]